MQDSHRSAGQKMEIFAQSQIAVHRHVFDFTLPLMDDNLAEWGSGTLIEIAGKWFVATARHCIPASPNGRLRLHSVSRQHTSDPILSFLKHGRHPSWDVGYLELDPTVARGHLAGKVACPINRIDAVGIGDERAVVSLIGCPVSGATVTQRTARGPVIEIKNNSYATCPLGQSEWPNGEDQQVHVLLPYPEKVEQAETRREVDNFLPKGFSGGGVWDHGHPHPGVWQPELAKLIAIQSSWNEESRYLRAVQIVHWLTLLFNDYPELRAELGRSFPTVRFPDLT